MEFRILGPFGAFRDGEPIPLGPVQRRALLAVLLLHGGEPVSTDRLIDQLWGERAPARAAKTVQVYVSHLRKAIGAGRIVTEGRGYRLAVQPDEVDAGAFEALRSEGRRALADGDPARARELLCSALGLWRGEPLDDFAYEPFAQAEIARLREARRGALEDRIEADLALGCDGELIPEIESLVAANPLQERLRGQLMVALYRAGRQADALAVYRQTSEMLREELGLEPGRSLQSIERAILEQDEGLDAAPHITASKVAQPDVCPFKGLAFFERADAPYFCGREATVSELLARVVQSPLVGIIGSSGTGKSSLLRAGLLPALSAGSLPGSADWRHVLLRPGEHPLAELRRALDGEPLVEAIEVLSPGERLVIAVDQLEELFTLCELEEERAGFLDQLSAAAIDLDRRAAVIVSLRADFYGRCASHPRFAGLLSRSHVLVGAMDRDELARAIEEPAARAALRVEPGLADALVSDVAGEPGALPLLSTMLLELWRGRAGRTLRYDSYRTSGGVRGAVARLAEAAYTRLGEERERRIARGVLLRLVSGENGALARRRVPLAELEQITGAGPVLAELTDARLLTVSDGEVELSHEALLREWPRYRAWLEEDQIGRRLHAHLTASAHDWDARSRDPGELYRGARLAAALDWVARHDDQLTALERDFIQASRLESDRTARRQRSQNRRLRSLLLGAGVLLVFAVVAGVIALVKQQNASDQARRATTAARVALARQLGAQAVNEPRLDRAMLLAREAVNLDRSAQTEGTLLATLQRNPAVIGTFALPVDFAPQLALSPDGRTLAVSHFLINSSGGMVNTSLGDIRFYDPQTHAVKQRPVPYYGGAGPPVYSSDGSLLAYPNEETPRAIEVRDAHTLALLRKLTLDPLQAARVTPDVAHASIQVAPDARTVYCAYRVFDTSRSFAKAPGATYLARWSLPSGRRVLTTRIDSGAVLAIRLIDGGARLRVVDSRRISVFGATSLRILSSIAIRPATAAPTAAAISPDGRTIAVGSAGGVVSFVDPSTGEARAASGVHGSALSSLTFSPDGRAVASTGDDNKVIIWDSARARSAEVLTAPAEQVQGVAFSPDGRTLYTSSLGGILLEWDLAGERSFGRRFALGTRSICCGKVSPLTPPLALSPNGTTFAVRLGPATVGLVSARTMQQIGSFTIRPKGTTITALTWSPTRPELAVAGTSGLLQLWRVDGTPRMARALTGLQPPGQPEAIQAVTYSPDGRLVAASDSAEAAQQTAHGAVSLAAFGNRLANLAIWQASTGNLVGGAPRYLGTGKGLYGAVAVSPDAKLLAVSVPDSSVLVLDLSSGQVRQTLHPLGADDTVSLAFAPKGTLATGTQGGIVQLWNPMSGAQVGGPVAVADGAVTSIAFDPPGRRFVTTGGQNGAVKLWSTSPLEQQGSALGASGAATTTAAFGAGGDRLLAVDNRGRGFVWPASVDAWMQRACAVAGRNLSRQEWFRYVPGRPYQAVCS